MKLRSLLIIFLLFFSNSVSSTETNNIEKSLIGFWHMIPDMPSGWAETYSFFPNGTYVFHTNSMLCSERTISIEGSWNHKDGILTLVQKEKTHLIGGKLEPAFGSCFDDYELVDAKQIESKIEPNTTVKIKLMEIEKDERFNNILSNKITLNKTEFWKFSNDPNYRK